MGASNARQRAPRNPTSRNTLRTISPTTARFAPRRTSIAAPTSTERSRTQMAPTLTAIPTAARSRKPRSTLTRAGSRSSRGELLRWSQPQAVEHVAADDAQRREAIDDAAPEADRAGLLEVTGRDGDLADPIAHTRGHHLRDQLLVEHEVVAVAVIGDRLEEAAAVGAQAGVEFGQAETEREILDAREESVADVLPPGHATRKRVAEEPVAEHQFPLTRGDRGDQGRDPRRVVLVVRVEHHDDVGACGERRVVAGLLVPAVPAVLGVD